MATGPGRWLLVFGALMAVTALDRSTVSATGSRRAPIAAVHFIRGGLAVQPPNARRQRGRVKQPLFPAYFLQTADGQIASLRFTDGTVLHMNQRTDAVLRSPTRTLVRRGEVDEIDAPGTHHIVTTANAIAAAVGTEFDVRITAPPSSPPSYGPTPTPLPASLLPAGTTTVSVTVGSVRVSNGLGSVTVLAGQWTHVRPGSAPTTPTRHNARADVGWTRGIPP